MDDHCSSQSPALRRRRHALAGLAARESLRDVVWLTDGDLATHRYAAVAGRELHDLRETSLERLLTVHETEERPEQATAGAAARIILDLDDICGNSRRDGGPFFDEADRP